MRGFEDPFDHHHVFPDNHVLHDLTISGKTSDKGANKLISEGRLPINERARNLQRHGFSVVGQDPVFVGPFPRFEILIDKLS